MFRISNYKGKDITITGDGAGNFIIESTDSSTQTVSIQEAFTLVKEANKDLPRKIQIDREDRPFIEEQIIGDINDMAKNDGQLEAETAIIRKRARIITTLVALALVSDIVYTLYEGTFSKIFNNICNSSNEGKSIIFLIGIFIVLCLSAIYYCCIYTKTRPIVYVKDEQGQRVYITGDKNGNLVVEKNDGHSMPISKGEAYSMISGGNQPSQMIN